MNKAPTLEDLLRALRSTTGRIYLLHFATRTERSANNDNEGAE